MMNKLILYIVYGIALFSVASSATACYYEGDPVKTATGYDVPQSMTIGDCYYEADENVSLDQIDGDYYFADLSESRFNQIADEQKTLNQSEFSVFEVTDTPVTESKSQTPVQSHDKSSKNDSENYDWVPLEWYRY